MPCGPPGWSGEHGAAGRRSGGTGARGGGRPEAQARLAARERCGLPLARPPVGGAALSPQPPPQPPPGPPRVPGGAAAAAAAPAAASSMRTEPGPGHGDPQHHGSGQPFCLTPLPPTRAGRRRHASPGMCGLGWARARCSRGSRRAPRRAPLREAMSLGAGRPVEAPQESAAAGALVAEPPATPPSNLCAPPPPGSALARARSLNAGSPCSRPWSRPSLAEMWRKCVPSSRRRRTSMCW